MGDSKKITDANMAQLNHYSKADAAHDALAIYLSTFAGDIATICHANSPAAQYPLGSVAPFVIDHTGHPVIQAAGIAQHSINAAENPKTSLIVRDISKNHHVETGWRLTTMGDLLKVSDDERDRVAKCYFRHYPKAKRYEGMHDFNFYRLNVKFARIIMGFGRISWVNADDICHPSLFDEATEDGIIEHMNNDHVNAMETYLSAKGVELKHLAKAPQMVNVNQFGITLRYRKHLHFIGFEKEAKNAMAVRKQLIAMTQ